jgi:hypothetical protein
MVVTCKAGVPLNSSVILLLKSVPVNVTVVPPAVEAMDGEIDVTAKGPARPRSGWLGDWQVCNGRLQVWPFVQVLSLSQYAEFCREKIPQEMPVMLIRRSQ